MSDPSRTTSTTQATGADPRTGESHELKRVIGPGLLLLFIMGDVLGIGVYTLSGKIAGQIGGAAWAPILTAFVVATITAFSYLELVTKYPGAAGAALYTHKAFRKHFFTFIVAFAVLCSGLTSSATASTAVAINLSKGFGWELGSVGITVAAVAFLGLVALINLRGVAEFVKLNVVLTCVELTGVLIVLVVGFWAVAEGRADFSRTVIFETQDDKSVFMALTAVTTLAFYSFIGFEDSVNMVEETKDPTRNFPRMMLMSLSITCIIYIAVSLVTVAIVPIGELGRSNTPLLDVVHRAAPGIPIDTIYPFLTIFAVSNAALINMLMASRLLYGLAKQGVVPASMGKVLPGRRTPWVSIVFTTVLGMALIVGVNNVMGQETAAALGGTTALLLLAVFTVVNIAVIILRTDHSVRHEYFHAPTVIPYLGALTCAYLVGPWAQELIEYQIALILIGVGVVLWGINYVHQRRTTGRHAHFEDTRALARLDEIER